MAMIIITDNKILKQNEGEKFQDFCERAKIWDSSQSGSQPKCTRCGDTGFVQDEHGRERCKCSQPSTRLIDQKFSRADLSQPETSQPKSQRYDALKGADNG